MISEQISHYRVLARLGAGGMGEVYLAEDTRLGRQVALKFLPASFQYDQDRRSRFLKEARAASMLRSPNIAAIYDIGEHKGASYIVMEYVAGETLACKLGRGPLHFKQVIDIGLQIADALDEAHRLGIIHRDIKPANLIITERGLVKVLDFGLAKLTGPDDDSDSDRTMKLGAQTAFGVVMGTVSYMSPEQALARPLDNRSDIFSLGTVLYEMLTGRLPFEGRSFTEIVDNILHKEPPAFTGAIPARIERVTARCLEKDRERRYQSMRELLEDLQAIKRDCDSGAFEAPPSSYITRIFNTTEPIQSTGGAETAQKNPSAYTARSGETALLATAPRKSRARRSIDSLAILPLVNVTNDPDTEYLTDGITESIINSLSQLPRLRVMARSTVFRYKGKEIDPLEVGRELNVRAVLTGRALQRGDTLVIKAELVDASDGAQLWGEQYNRKLQDIFAIEEEISREISEKLKWKLSGEQKKRLTKRHTEKTEAYQLYLKGRYSWNKRTVDGLMRSIEDFTQATLIDPGYALAYAGLADAYNILASYSAMPPAEAFPKAKQAAERALELDETLAEAHTSLAFVRLGYEWDRRAAERGFKRAIKLNPGYATAHLWYAVTLAAMGRTDEGLREIERARELDPLSLPINTNFGWLYYLARQYDKAVEQYMKTLELDPNYALARRRLGQAYEQRREYDKALAEFEAALALSKGDTETIAAIGHLYAVSGKEEEARRVIQELVDMSDHRYIPSYFIARILIGLGERDQAFEYLDKAYEERYGFLSYLKVEPLFDSLRADERFVDLARRVGLDS